MSRIINILLMIALLWRLGLASTNNHQLSSSVSASVLGSSDAGRFTANGDSDGRADPSGSQTSQQHVTREEKLIDNKLRDKLLSLVGRAGSHPGRGKREVLDEESIYYGNRINNARNLEEVPRITEEVLLVRNLSGERLQEENDLLQHLNRERFPASTTRSAGSAPSRKTRPGGGKKGRRRKGHKKKIKRIKPIGSKESGLTAGADLAFAGLELGPERWVEEQINSSLTSVTKLSVNESEQQTQRAGGRNGRPLSGKFELEMDSPDQADGSERVSSERFRPEEGRGFVRLGSRNGNWERKAEPKLGVLNNDDIYNKNIQTNTERALAEEHRSLPDGKGDPGQPQSEVMQYWTQGAEEKAAREARRQRQRELKKLEQQRRQTRKFKKGKFPLPSEPTLLLLQQLPPASPTDASPGVSSVTFASDDMQRTEAVSLQRIIIAGDLSCMRGDFVPAPAVPNADIKYLRNDIYGLENSFLEAEYHCRRGFQLRFPAGSGNNSNLICRKSRWVGKRPSCVRLRSPAPSGGTFPHPAAAAGDNDNNLCARQHNCQQACYVRKNATRVCSCFKGFKMLNGRCVDINECTEFGEDMCEYGCSNTIGSFICKCPKGLRVTDNNNCMDVNECVLRNGHGPCQDTCINTWSGYRCSCAGLPGTRLAEDGHSCEDIDECTVNNGGCSHICLNTLGRAFCVCPEGYMLDDDWKTCIDIDECSNQKSIRQEFRCLGSCVNTVGSYRCIELEPELGGGDGVDDNNGAANGARPGTSSEGGDQTRQSNELADENDDTLCPTGYFFNTTMGDCQDTNECVQTNGGCEHHCINSDGSFYCSCKYGFKLDVDKRSCLVLNDSLKLADIACPPLFPPRHGYLECSRPIDEITDGPNGGRLKITNRPGSQCILKCPTGYRLEGKFSKICGTSGEWIGDESGTCTRYPQPRLTCPSSVNVELHPNETDHTTVKLRRPKSDVSWDRDIVADPYWAKRDVLQLPLGSINISYTAKHPVSKLTTGCTFTVNVIAGSAPTVDFCPDTQIYTIEGRHQSVKATWEEPIFSDNVGVVTITKSNSPGTDFGAGSHLITYEAHDAAEWSAKCVFKIVVDVSKRKDVQHFQLPILYNRFYF